MQIEIRIKRQKAPNTEAYYESYLYDGDGNITIADFLTQLNLDKDRKTMTGIKSDPIVWECSCMEKKCGACAMRINGKPMLACAAFLSERKKRGKITVEPFSKFPIISDLKVDRAAMFEILKKMQIWLEEKSWTDYGQDSKLQYQAGQCLMCGCCLEACPNYLKDGLFGGAAAMIQAYKTMEQQANDEHRKQMKKEYETYFHSSCGQALACKRVCPLKLPLDDIQARANFRK